MEIRWYYQLIRRSWWIILIGALVPAIIAFTVSYLLPPEYQAQAEVSLYKTQPELAFDAKYITLSEDDIVHYSNPDARRNTLVALSTSDQVFIEILQALPEEFQDNWSLTQLHQAANADTSGNLIHLSVRSIDPQQAVTVSNLWAETFIEIANSVYSRPSESLQAVEGQLFDAYKSYDQAQHALEGFLLDNQFDELSRLISWKEQAIYSIQESSISSAQTALTELLFAQQKIPVVIENARALRNEMDSSPDVVPVSLASRLTALIIEAGSFGSGVKLPAELQLSINIPEADLTRAQAVTDLNQLISSLESLVVQYPSLISDQVNSILTTPDTGSEIIGKIQTIQSELDPLRSQLEVETAQKRELTDQRDLAWENCLTLERKKAEYIIAATDINTEVIIAAKAVTPEQPVSPNIIINTAIGLVLGFIAIIIFIILRAQIELIN